MTHTGAPIEIAEDLWQVGGAGLTDERDAAVYLVRFGAQAALIDAGCGFENRRLAANIDAALPAGTTIPYLFLTHCHFDHSGGAAALRERFGCRIVAHALEARHLAEGDSTVTAASWYGAEMPPLAVDETVTGARRDFAVGDGTLSAHHCPGHSPGSLVYLAEVRGLRVLFAQDVHGPLHPSLLSDPGDYRRSLHLMRSLAADLLCEGHYGVVRGRQAAADFIEGFLRRPPIAV